jgi:dihydroneopterin aldolase
MGYDFHFEAPELLLTSKISPSTTYYKNWEAKFSNFFVFFAGTRETGESKPPATTSRMDREEVSCFETPAARLRAALRPASLIASSSLGMLRNLILDWSGTLADDLGPVVEATNLLPHALGFLCFCRATRRRLFLLSAIKEAHFAEQSARLGVAHFFERAYVGVMDKRERIREILDDNNLAPLETAFIGDTVHDVETAQHGGVMAIATLTGFDSREKLSRANPDVLVRDLGELQKLLAIAPPNDEIRIEELELSARVGVPEEERAQPQRLTVSITLQPRNRFGDLADDLARTIDYAAVCEDLRQFVSGREDKLIETLANEMAEHLIRRFAMARVELELRKFVLPETRYVAVRVARVSTPVR